MNEDKPVSFASKIITVLLLIAVIVASLTFIYFVLVDNCCEGEPDHDFGDSMLNGTYSADAYALTTDGLPVGEGIETMADPPTVVFGEDFEGTETWSLDDSDTDSPHPYWGSESAYLDPTVDGSASANYTFSTPISVASDETVETYFYINASTSWDSGDGDFFVLNVTFIDGKSLVYLILGTYVASGPNEKVVSVGVQVTAKGMWVGINLQRIDEDYVVQFSEALPIPDIESIGFILESSEAEDVYVDEMEIVTLPRALTTGYFWKKVPSGEKVSSYFVDVSYTIYISGDVDPDSVHAEFKLWIEIYDGSDPGTMLLAKTLIQDEVVPYVDAGVLNEWTSKVFALPEDDTAFGGDLQYAFYILVEAWGEIITSPGDFLYASDDNDGEAFDSLHFQFVVVEGSIDVVITSLYMIGSIGTVATLVGIARARKKGRGEQGMETKLSEKESWYN